MKNLIITIFLIMIHTCGYTQNFEVINPYMDYKEIKIDIEKSTENSDLGWKLLFENKISVAENRFKKAYSLNKNNMIAVWGMGVLSLMKEEYDVSLKLFDEAYVVLNKNENFLIDYAKALSLISIHKRDEKLLNKSFNIFEQIYSKNKNNTYNLQNWAIALMLTGDITKAVLLIEEAKKTKQVEILDQNFLDELSKLKK